MFDPCFEFGTDGLHQTLKVFSQDLLGRYGKGEGFPKVPRTWYEHGPNIVEGTQEDLGGADVRIFLSKQWSSL